MQKSCLAQNSLVLSAKHFLNIFQHSQAVKIPRTCDPLHCNDEIIFGVVAYRFLYIKISGHRHSLSLIIPMYQYINYAQGQNRYKKAQTRDKPRQKRDKQGEKKGHTVTKQVKARPI